MQFDVVILGGGMVGLSLAHQLLERYTDLSILVVDKETRIGCHSSGRNSGVLHAGVYYPPDTLKAKVCVSGARRLRAWCEAERLPVLNCGKVIAPQAPELDEQLDLLLKRGRANGAHVELVDEAEFHRLVPDGRTATGRALWTPDTCVVKPKLVLERLEQRLREKGVVFYLGAWLERVRPDDRCLSLQSSSGEEFSVSYGHLFNATVFRLIMLRRSVSPGNAHCCRLRGCIGSWIPGHPFISRPISTRFRPQCSLSWCPRHSSPDGSVTLGPRPSRWGRENYRGLEGLNR